MTHATRPLYASTIVTILDCTKDETPASEQISEIRKRSEVYCTASKDRDGESQTANRHPSSLAQVTV